MNLLDVIKRPVITEKAISAQSLNKYVFEVHRGATKFQVKSAVEQLFEVKVRDVRTSLQPGKAKRSLKVRGLVSAAAPWKKAVVTLADGEKLELVEGV